MTKQEIQYTLALWKIRATIYCVFALIHCRKWASNLARLEPWFFRLQERLEDTLPKPPLPPLPPLPTRRTDGQIGNKNALPFPNATATHMATKIQSIQSEAMGREQLAAAYKGEFLSVPGLLKGKKPFCMPLDEWFMELPDMINYSGVEFIPSEEFQKRMKRRKMKTSVLLRKLNNIKKDKKK